MKLYLNTYKGKRIARLEVLNEFSGEKRIYKGFLNTRNSQNGEFEYCELILEKNESKDVKES